MNQLGFGDNTPAASRSGFRPSFGSFKSQPNIVRNSSQPRFGKDVRSDFDKLLQGAGLSDEFRRTAADLEGQMAAKNTAKTVEGVEHLEGLLEGLDPTWEREPLGQDIKKRGLRLTEEGMREDDDLKKELGTLYEDCGQRILDPLSSPEDIIQELAEDIIDLKSQALTSNLDDELKNF